MREHSHPGVGMFCWNDNDLVRDPAKFEVDAGLIDRQIGDLERFDPDGRAGRSMCTCLRRPSIRTPRIACNSMKTEPDAQACGRQATG
jgi:hypothetical protein